MIYYNFMNLSCSCTKKHLITLHLATTMLSITSIDKRVSIIVSVICINGSLNIAVLNWKQIPFGSVLFSHLLLLLSALRQFSFLLTFYRSRYHGSKMSMLLFCMNGSLKIAILNWTIDYSSGSRAVFFFSFFLFGYCFCQLWDHSL